MAKRKNAVKPTVNAKRGRGRSASNKRSSNKTAVRTKSAKSLKGSIKSKRPAAVKKTLSKLKSKKGSTRKNITKLIKQAPIANKKRGRPAKSKAANSNKAFQVPERKIANA